MKQYIKKTKNGDESITTDISQHRLKNHKYSKYLANIIVLLSSIEHISYEKISEILNLFFKINISRQRVYDLYAKNVKEFIYKNMDEIQEYQKEAARKSDFERSELNKILEMEIYLLVGL